MHATAPARPGYGPQPPYATLRRHADVLRSEVRKLRTVRSTYWALAAVVVSNVAVAALLAIFLPGHMSAHQKMTIALITGTASCYAAYLAFQAPDPASMQGDPMPAAEAAIETEHPDRYLAQLCKHASKMGRHLRRWPGSHADGAAPPEIRHSEWSGSDGTVTLNWGQWTMHAGPGTLTVRAEADSEEHLRRIQDLLTTRLEKIGRRDHPTVTWHPPAPSAA